MITLERKKIVLTVRILLPLFIAIVFFYFLQHPLTSNTYLFPITVAPQAASTTTESTSMTVISNPVTLLIPSINLKAHIQHVGKTWSGSMAVPTNFTDAGWYKLGTMPGGIGNAVIDGHVDNALGLDGVFKNLDKLQKGDLIYVENASGTRSAFKVVSKEIYEYNHAPLERIFGATSTRALNLITCSGTWLSADHTDSHRLVIYTEAVTNSQ